ncbi:hypothetical protein [Nocardioides sp. GXQ0305]|uniref:hypothetical protein n=1 Tax=Nocardioides sp. GXQ0305 TaxID=3423912 RepID=UPI003D7C5C9C
MSGGQRRWVAWVPFAVTVLLVAGSLMLPQERRYDTADLVPVWVLNLVLDVQALTFATVSLVILRARPGHAIGRLFAGVGMFVGLYLFAERYQYYSLVFSTGDLPLDELAAWLQSWTYVPALAIVVTVLPQLFPDGRPVSPRWRWGLWLAGVAFVGMVANDALTPGTIDQSVIENPTAISPAAYEVVSSVSILLWVASAVVAFASIVARWRRAGRRERQQLKLFAYAAFLLPLFVVASGISDGGETGGPVLRIAAFLLAFGAFLGLPIATAASIVRHRLYDIDLVINRTLVYAILTTLLVATYLVSVLLFRLVLDPLTGKSDLAVAASTLAVAGLFRPLRSRVQAAVDRRFYRSRYDAALTLSAFTDRLRHEVDLDSLGTELRSVVHDTMQPTHVSLWIRTDP